MDHNSQDRRALGGVLRPVRGSRGRLHIDWYAEPGIQKKLCIENNDLALTISSEGRKYNEKSTGDSDIRVAVCLEVLRMPVSCPGRSRARTEGIVTLRNFSLQPFTKPRMLGLPFPAPINDDVECWQ